jgi:hypothetical protein
MTEQPRHESADLGDYEVDDAYDTLDGDPGDDPLDRGVTPPQRWSRAIRSDPDSGESLDELLAEEEPDASLEELEELEDGDGEARNIADDPDASDEDVDGLLLDDGPDPRAGRLVADDEGAHPARQPDLVAHDEGIAGGAATAEEAAVHVVPDDDNDIRSES